MKEGLADKILEKITLRRDKLTQKMSKELKGTKPFAQPVLTPEEKIWALDNITMADMQQLYQEYGESAMLYLQAEREKLGRRIGNGQTFVNTARV